MDRLTKQLATRRDVIINLARTFIQIPSVNPPGAHYLDMCHAMANYLEPLGFTCELIRAKGAPGDSESYPRWNLVARKEGSAPGPCVHFNGHIDVVEAGEGWTRDPYGAQVEGDLIYGRGACDMKGGIAAAMIAAEAFITAYPDFAGAVEISGTADEESGGYGGVAYLAEQGYFSPERVQHVIIPEPLHKDQICLGHRGGWWAEIATKGEIAHGAMPFLGDCAVRHMGAVIEKFEQQLFPALAERRTEMPVIPEGARQPTLNINSIHGGQKHPDPQTNALPSHNVPDHCAIVIDRRYLPEETKEDVAGEITQILERLKEERPKFRYELRELNHVAPSFTAKDAPVVTAVAGAIADVLGKEAGYVASPGSYDQKHIDRIGTLKNCIAYGPGLLHMAHKPDEFISITDMIDSAHVMAHTLKRILAFNP